MAELGMVDLSHYREYLVDRPDEWEVLDSLCQVSISRFYRDRGVFDALRDHFLPALADRVLMSGGHEAWAWSAGCGCGEEAYTLQIIWQEVTAADRPGRVDLHVVATGTDAAQLDRARKAVYPASSLKDLPAHLARRAFEPFGGHFALRDRYKRLVRVRRQDLRRELPEEHFDIILCRNMAFTYFDDGLQADISRALSEKLAPGGLLVIGAHERIPGTIPPFRPHPIVPCAFSAPVGDDFS